MPRNPRSRRRRLPRRLPPRPGAEAGQASGAQAREDTRPARLVEREAPFLKAELRRVATVSGVCFALLGALVLLDRLS